MMRLFESGSGQSPNDFSYAFLVQPNTFANFDAIIGVYSGTGGATSAGSMGFTFRDYATDRALWPFVESAYPLTRFEFLAGDWLLVTGYYTDGDSAMYLNGTLVGSVADSISPIQINRIDLGTYNGGGVTRAPDDVIFSYASIIDRKTTTDERQKWEGYLAWTRGLQSYLPSSHPYRFDGSLFGYGKLWSPFELSATTWYDAADLSTITESSGSVSQWNDLSGNGNHTIQATGANQPVTNNRTQNSLNLIDFQGSQYFSAIPNVLGTTRNFYISALGAFDSNGVFFLIGTGGTRAYIYNSSGSIRGRVVDPQITSPTDTDLHIFELVSDENGDWSFWIDGAEIGSLSAASEIALTDLYLGSLNGTSILDGVIGEVLVSEHKALADRQKNQGYLAHKWGLQANLPVDHPYKGAAPTL